VCRALRAAVLLLLTATPLAADVRISTIPVAEAEGDSGFNTFTISITQGPQNLPGTYNYQTIDGTATAADNDYVPTSGTVVIPADGGTAFIEISIVGDRKVEADEIFTVDVSGVPNGPYEITIQNDDIPVLTVASASVTEGNSGTTALVFPVTMTTEASVPVTAVFQTGGGSATAGVDYVPTEGTITFAPGQSTQNVTVTVNGDTLVEPDETLILTVAPSGGFGPVIAPVTATGTIRNDDALALTVTSPSVQEGNAGPTAMTFDVSIGSPSATQVLVSYTTEAGTATAGQDFIAAQGTLIFNPNDTRQTVTVTINGDTAFEPDETLTLAVTLANAAPVRGTGTILNDDAAPPTSLTIVGGNNQSGILGLPLAQPLVVEVRDARGAVMPNVTVQWRVIRGSAALSSPSTQTNAQGRASITATSNSVGAIEVEASVAGLTPVRFTINSSTSLEIRAEGPVAVPVARTLDEICARNEETFAEVCRALATLPDAEITPTLERVAPQTSGVQARMATEFVSSVVSGVRNRLSAVRRGADRISIQQLSLFHKGKAIPVAMLASAFLDQATDAGAPEDEYNGWSAFLSGNFGSGERDSGDGLLGFDLETRGFSFGVDRLIGQSGVAGVAVNWMSMDSELDDLAGTVDTSGYAVSLYASRAGLFGGGAPGRAYDGVHLDGIVTFGRNTYESEHVVDIPSMPLSRATSENDASVLAVSAGAGIEAHRGRGDFDVSLSGTWSRSDIDDMSENGSGPLILFVQGHEIESLTATLGLSARGAWPVPFGTLLPSIRAELVQELESDARLVTARFLRDTLGTSFTVPVDRPDSSYGKIAAGLQAEFGFGWSALVEVTQDVSRDDLNFRNLQFTLRKAFR
jgi:Autotransporter beta-domain/Calx-beta domain/Bacterial Ig-like domain (group 1)